MATGGRLRLKRRVGECIDIVHRSGDVIRVELVGVRGSAGELAFLDAPRHFEVRRPIVSPAGLVTAAGEG